MTSCTCGISVQAAPDVQTFIADRTLEAFLEDEVVRSATQWKLTVIGEAASQLPKAFKQRHEVVDWGIIVGFRNRAIHGYFSIDWEIVWETAAMDIPELESQIEEILKSEYPSTQTDKG